MTLAKVISGGQSGVDMAALRAARAVGLATGGTAPRGYRTEAGPAPWLRDFGLTESASSNYQTRTRQNVMDADATLIFEAVQSPGTRLTIVEAQQSCKPFKIIRAREPMIPAEEVAAWLTANKVRTLNCAGHRESVCRGIGELVEQYLGWVFGAMKNGSTL